MRGCAGDGSGLGPGPCTRCLHLRARGQTAGGKRLKGTQLLKDGEARLAFFCGVR